MTESYYGYATLEDGSLIAIDALNRENRRSFGRFFCFSCKRELIPALGEKVRHHFKHKKDKNAKTECNFETYLHKAAKYALAGFFNDAVREGRPFNLVRKQPLLCEENAKLVGRPCDTNSQLATFDLTKWFKTAEVEKGVGGFVADVLLTGPQGEMLLEVAVTHPCSDEKIASGLRIVEIGIKEEADITKLKGGIISAKKTVKEYNLKAPEGVSVRKCPKPCWKMHSAALAYRSGKHWTGRLSNTDIAEKKHKAVKMVVWDYDDEAANKFADDWLKISHDSPMITKAHEVIMLMHMHKFKLKNCIVCKHGCRDERRPQNLYCSEYNTSFSNIFQSEKCKKFHLDTLEATAREWRVEL